MSNKNKPMYPERTIPSRDDKINTRINVKVSPINNEAESVVAGTSRAYLNFQIDNRTNDFVIESTGLSYDGSLFNLDEVIDALLLLQSVKQNKRNKHGIIS